VIKIAKVFERFKKEQNLPSTGYLYIKAEKKARAEIKKRHKQHQEEHAAHQDKKHETVQTTQSNLSRTHKAKPVRSSAEVSSPMKMDALKSKNRVRPQKKLSACVEGQPAKTNAVQLKNESVAPIPKTETTHQTAQPSDQNPHNSLSDSMPRYNEHKIDKNLISVFRPYSLETDIFKVLRGKILFPTSGRAPRSIMVTSAVPNEGKSFIASNLAVNLAQNIAEYVLLVDCDLRRPCLHQNFGFDKVKGLSEHLSHGSQLSSLFLKTVIDKLTLLPAGQPPLNPSEILSSAKMADLINELKSRYDDRYLIIDSPPPMLAPETSAIAKRVDGIIVVIKFGDTSVKIVEKIIEDLGKEKIIGAVINRIDKQNCGYYYGYTKYRKYYY
jgi:capsular exopolysaccharide synthesis family protein